MFAILVSVNLFSCATRYSYGKYGLLLTAPIKKSEELSIIPVPGTEYSGESCSAFFFVPIGDGFQHMEYAIKDALKNESNSKIVGLADAEVQHELRWYVFFLKTCWLVNGIAAKVSNSNSEVSPQPQNMSD